MLPGHSMSDPQPALASLPEPQQLVMSDGYVANYRLWQPTQPSGRALILLHGIQSHSGWYYRSCSHWAHQGWLVIAPDRRGSGTNTTHRGDVLHVERWLFDISAWINFARSLTTGSLRQSFRDQPLVSFQPEIVLAGLSWGGRLAAAYASLWPENLSAYMLLYPGICPRIEPTRLQKLLLKFVQRTSLSQKLKKIPGLEPSRFTRNISAQEFIARDALALREATFRFFWHHHQLGPLALQGLSHPQRPVFLALAGQDQIIDSHRTQALFQKELQRSQLPHELQWYAEAAHTIEFEPCHTLFLEQSTNWLNRVFPAFSQSA